MWVEKMRAPLAAKAGTYGRLTLLDLPPRHGKLIVLAQQCVCSTWDFNKPLFACPRASFLSLLHRKQQYWTNNNGPLGGCSRSLHTPLLPIEL